MNKLTDFFKRYAIITLGTAIVGFSISCFMAPIGIIAGGVSGVATIINHLSGFPLGIVSLVLNIPIFIWGVIKLGKSLGAATVFGTVAMSVFIDIFAIIGPLTDDLLLGSLFGGLISGVGYGLVFYSNATTGGVDIVAKIIQNKYRHLQLGKIILIVDLLIIAAAMIIYDSVNIGLYSVISLWIISYVIDRILEGFNFAKLIFVVSDFSTEISHNINTRLSRGATILDGYGSYTKNRKEIIMCTIKVNEIPLFKDIVKTVDENAFVLITDVREVLGEGFLRY